MKALKTILTSTFFYGSMCLGLLLIFSSISYGQSCAGGTSSSFTDDIAPILSAKCGNCHGTQGGFSVATYASTLAGGTFCGPAVTPGDATAAGSSLIDKTQWVNGGANAACGSNMPTGGTPLTAAEFQLIEAWIAAGAPENCPMPIPCDLYIAGVLDGPLGGGTPKGVQLCAANDIADLSIYGVSSANNGGGATGAPEFTFPAVPLAAGECIWIASEATEFENFFGAGCTPDYVDGAVNVNGDDAIELFENGAVIDVYGDVAVDGTGQPWEYLDGWATATDTDCNGGTFTGANWTFSGANALDNETDNGTAANPYPNAPACDTPVCDLMLVEGTAVCDAETAGDDMYTATFTFTDADGLGTYTVTASQGTPDMLTVTDMASGTITVTGATEGTDVILTMTDGVGCDIMVTVTTPTCVDTSVPTIETNPDIADPCNCAEPNNIDLEPDGIVDLFFETVVITSDPGETWTCGTCDGIFDATGAEVNTVTFVEAPAGTYTATFYHTASHTPAAGYTGTFTNGTAADDQSASNSCTACVAPVACGACTEGSAGLVITELSYDPSGTQGNDGDCEYIELFNSYSNAITLDANTTLELSNGASFTFPAGTTIAPGEYIIIAINPTNFGTCVWATPPPAGTQIFGPTTGSLANAGESVDITLACATNPAVDFTQSVAFSDGTTPTAGGSGDAVYYPLDGLGPLASAPTPGSGDCTGCAATEFTCEATACPTTQVIDGAAASVCTLDAEIAEWKADVEATGGAGAIVDDVIAPTLAFVVYSATGGQTDYDATFDATEPSGVYAGLDCANDPQTTYAYVVCDLNSDEDNDPATNTADVTLTEVGSIEITYFPPAQIPTIVRDDATCTYSYIEACAGDIFDPATIPTAAPGEAPAAAPVTVTTANGCTAMFDVDIEACPSAACTITDISATAPACSADGLSYTVTVTVMGTDANNSVTLDDAGSTEMSQVASGMVTFTYADDASYNIIINDTDGDCVFPTITGGPIDCTPAPVCSITNTVFTQACTGTDEEYNLCVSFDYADVGASGQFNVYLDPAGTGTPATIVAGPFNYTDYQAAINGGETCFTVTGYTGDATDLEAGLEVCIGDADAPAPGTGLPPGSTPPPAGIPAFACPQVYGILHNACAPPDGDEGPNEFVVIVNGAEDTPVSAIVVDTPSGSDYDDFNTTAAPASWTCPCCVYLDETGTIPAGGVVVATSAANVSTLDFTSLCGTAGTIYVLQDDGVGITGHFSNNDPRTTLLNITGTASCDGSSSYTYTNADGADGDYTTFNSPDSPAYPAAGNNGIDNASTDVVNSSGDCTPQIAPVSEVECFNCTTLTEVACETCPTDIEGMLGVDMEVCSDDNAVDLMVSITGGGAGPYTVTYNDGIMDIVVAGYNDGDVITVSPTTTTTYTLISITDANGCIGAESGTALITVTDPPSAGTAGTATACSNAADGNTIVDLDAALGGMPDAFGVWTEGTTSNVSLANTMMVDFNGIAPGTYTFTYTVPPNGLCEGAMANVVVTVTDCNTCPTDIDGVLSGDTEVCSDDTATDLMVTIGGGGMATYTVTYNDGTTDIILTNYNNGDAIPVSPTINTTYTLVDITDMNGCTGSVSGTATVTVNTAANAGVSGVANACNDATEGASVVDLEAALGGGQDAGTWMDASASGADISIPTAVDFNGLAAGTYTFTYTVMGTPPCSDVVTDVVVTVTDCATCPTDIDGVLSGDAMVCSDNTATDLVVTITGGGTGPYTVTYTDGAANVPVFNYNSGDPIPVSPSMTTTYTILSIIDVNSCVGTFSGTATVTVNTVANAGTAGAAAACNDNTEGASVVDLMAALGGTPDAGGAWTEVTTSGASLANPMAVDFNGLAVGTYTFTYTVTGAVPCANATANVVVTVTDCVTPPACTSPNVPVLTPQN